MFRLVAIIAIFASLTTSHVFAGIQEAPEQASRNKKQQVRQNPKGVLDGKKMKRMVRVRNLELRNNPKGKVQGVSDHSDVQESLEVFYLKDRDANSVKKMLEAMLGARTERVSGGSLMSGMVANAQGGSTGGLIEGLLGKDGKGEVSIVVDGRTNSLLIGGDDDQVKLVKRMIMKLSDADSDESASDSRRSRGNDHRRARSGDSKRRGKKSRRGGKRGRDHARGHRDSRRGKDRTRGKSRRGNRSRSHRGDEKRSGSKRGHSKRGHSKRDHSKRDHSKRDHSKRDHSKRDHSKKGVDDKSRRDRFSRMRPNQQSDRARKSNNKDRVNNEQKRSARTAPKTSVENDIKARSRRIAQPSVSDHRGTLVAPPASRSTRRVRVSSTDNSRKHFGSYAVTGDIEKIHQVLQTMLAGRDVNLDFDKENKRIYLRAPGYDHQKVASILKKMGELNSSKVAAQSSSGEDRLSLRLNQMERRVEKLAREIESSKDNVSNRLKRIERLLMEKKK